MINRREALSLGALATAAFALPAQAHTIPTTATTEDKSPINKGRSVKGTETEKCLLKAFAGESQARMRYTIFAERAEAEGYVQIRDIFIETAEQEKAHATRLFACLDSGDELTLGDAGYPAGKIGTTKENLLAAAKGENHEHEIMYPAFAKIADKEGFKEIATLFRLIAKAEVSHEKRYRAFVKKLDAGFFKSDDDETEWECVACGYIAVGAEAPKFCPVCGKPIKYFREAISYDED